MIVKRPLHYIFLFLLTSYVAQAQQSFLAYRTLADSLYKYHNYQDAADFYERASRLAPDSTGLMLRIARAYSQMNNVKVSEGWYAKAIAGQVKFGAQDTYDYVKDLLKLERREDARKVLRIWLEDHPTDQYARSLFQSVVSTTRYFRDSAAYVVAPVAAVNTPAAEFAPTYYKSGLLFTTSRAEGKLKRRYHWDKSHFLSLYFAERGEDQQWRTPVPFGREIHSEFHDGPATVYGNNQRMILNRNVQRRMQGTADIYVSHLALVDAAFDSLKKVWTTVGQPFIDSTYSYAHPFMTEDGQTLLFASDMPGGYGGSDLYIARRLNGQWQKPVNLGPLVNSPENEAFPFYIDHTLYFASDGHGGLGGLDLLISREMPYGFGLPENLGYPINSHLDDFALITRDQQQGYLSSSRSGNDDLYSFRKQPRTVKLLARVYDGKTLVSLPQAQIEILTDSRDQALVSGNGGYVPFELPEASAYMFVARLGDRIGILSGLADESEDRDHQVHEVALYADTTQVVCIGTLKGEKGLPEDASSVQVVDEVSGEVLKGTIKKSMVSFAGRRGHRYRITVTGTFGNVSTHTVDIQPAEEGVKTWSMTLPDAAALVSWRVQVIDSESQKPLAGARVLVTTALSPDQELTTDAAGQAATTLPAKAAYMVVASLGDYAGMQYGFAEVAAGRDYAVDTVYIKGPAAPPVHSLILVTNESGALLEDAVVTVRDDETGEIKSYPAGEGALGFPTQANRSYTVRVTRQGYTTVEKKLVTSNRPLEHLPVTLAPTAAEIRPIAVRVTRQNQPVADAQVQVLKLQQDDIRLRTASDGVVEFDVPVGESYIVSAAQQGSAAMLSGVVDPGQEQSGKMHVLEMDALPTDSVYLYGLVTNLQGKPISNVVVSVVNTTNASAVQVRVRDGVMSFPAAGGTSYDVQVSAPGYTEARLVAHGDVAQGRAPLPTVRLTKRLPVTLTIADPQGRVVEGAQIVVKDEATGVVMPATFAAGTLSFPGEQGKQYHISVVHDQYQPAVEEVVLPRLSDDVSPRTIALTPLNPSTGSGLAVRVLMAADKAPVAEATVKIISFAAEDMDVKSDDAGAIRFELPEGTSYMVMASKGDYAGMYAGLAERANAQSEVLLDKTARNRVMVITRVSDEQRRPVEAATVMIVDKRTGEKVPATLENGFLAFYGKKGSTYDINVQASGFEPATSSLEIKPASDFVGPVDIALHRIQTPEFQESLRVVRASNQAVLPQTAVKVISLLSDDQVLSTDDDGVVNFKLPAESAYMAIAQQGNSYGVYSGEGTGATSEVKLLVVNDTLSDRVPVVGLMKDGNVLVAPATVVVTDEATGTTETTHVNKGLFMFLGKKGAAYTIEVKSDMYETQVEKMRVNPDATQAQEIEISFTRRKMLVLPEGATLVVVHNEVPRLYVTNADTHDEIIEEGGSLYLVRATGKQLLGKGQLKDLAADPMRSIEMKPDQLEVLENIYFDFNSTVLDSADHQILHKTLRLLTRYPLLQLTINTHADTRGSAWYNLRLTRRRAKAVKHYLTEQGIKSRRVDARAYGKTSPAVICATAACSEQQHQKNRRAEFEMSTPRKQELKPVAVTTSAAVVMKPTAKARVSASYAALLAKYGARTKEGLVFKVCVGAYRLNPNLTFEELKNLGEIHRQEVDGIHYYYVQGYGTLQAAEEVRQQVMLRGITDAYLAIFFEDNKISFSRFIALTE